MLPFQSAGNPYPYLAAPVRRETHGAKLYWVDGSTKRYIAVDVIPSLEETQSSTLTQFPVQDGTVISDHIIHFPNQLKLEIIQTNEPFEDMDANGRVIQFPVEDLTLNLPKTSFRPRGMLALSLLGENLVGAAAEAVAGAFGFGSELGVGAFKVGVQKNPNVRDRINELVTSLEQCRLGARLLTLDWLGRVWSNLAIETLSYKRATGSSKGAVSLTLTQVTTTTSDVAILPDPSELRLKPEVNGGQRPAKTPGDSEQKTADDTSESVLHGWTGDL
jgi:hypothetical protein